MIKGSELSNYFHLIFCAQKAKYIWLHRFVIIGQPKHRMSVYTVKPEIPGGCQKNQTGLNAYKNDNGWFGVPKKKCECP